MKKLGAFTTNADLDRFRYVFRKKQSGVALSVYDGKKLIGKVGAITEGNCYTDDQATLVKYRRPADVVSAEILEEYRGKKLYQEMLLRFRKYAKEELGCKGLKSRGFQRSSMATRAWEKVADRFDTDEWQRKDFYLDGLAALPKSGRIPVPKGLGAAPSTKKIAEEWVRDTIANMLKERRLPVLGPGYSDEQRAEAAVESIIGRKTSYAMTLPQSRFWREAKKQLDARVKQRVERDNLEFEQEEAGRSSLRELRREEIERELRSGKYKGKSGAFIDKVIESSVQERLRSENLAGLPKTGRIPMPTVNRALKSLGRKAAACGITPASLRLGMEVEREHRDVTKGGVLKTAKIAAAHLCESPRYYTELKKLERKLKRKR